MVKLQQIQRSNGSKVHSVNLPLEIIEKIKWRKGIELDIKEELIGPGVYSVIITKSEDRKEVSDNGTD